MQRKHPFKRRFPLALVVILIVISTVAGVVYAKYIKSVPFSGNVTLSADLASGFTLYERTAQKQENGSYILLDGTNVTENLYTILPGLDIPKDPKIEITGKTKISAYLYIEVVDKINTDETEISYSLVDVWKPLGIKGANGGDIYVYASGDTPIVLDGTTADITVNILLNEKITVSQNLNRGYSETISLDFHAYMAQKVTDDPVTDFTTAGFTAAP